MLRVLQMIGALNVGGSQAMIMNIYRNIDRERIQFDFLLDRPEKDHYADEVRALGGRLFSVPMFTGFNAGEVRRGWDEFFAQHPEYKVLHSHVRSYASLYLPVAKRHGLKTIIHSHNTSNGGGLTAAGKKLLQYPLRKQADVLMACSSDAGKWLFGEKACQSEKYVFLPNGVDLSRFKQNEETRERCRQELGLSDKFVIGHVGRIQEAKNHAFLLDSFAEVFSQNKDARLLIVGDGDLRAEMMEKSLGLGLGLAVKFLGNRDDVPELMQAMDSFAFPSLWEGLPVTLVEAQASGLPCLISDRISKDVDISPLIERLPIKSPELWAREMLKKRERMDVSQQIADSGFDIHDSSEKLCRIYERLAGEAE